jgi:hypothetical protein
MVEGRMDRASILLVGVLLILFSAQSQMVLAACDISDKQANEMDARLGVAMDDYKRIVAEIANTANKSDGISKGILANSKLIEAMSNSIETLERAEAEGCLGKQAPTWKRILEDMKTKRNEFIVERETLLKAASAQAANRATSIPKADWQAFLSPSLKVFSACIVLTKRRALALDSKKPSPQDFALIMRGACNSEAAAIDTEQNRISDWTAANRQELKQAINSIRVRATSEYSEAFFGMR